MGDQSIYVIRVGTEMLLAKNQEQAINLLCLLSQAQPINSDFMESGPSKLKPVHDKTISLEIRPASDLVE